MQTESNGSGKERRRPSANLIAVTVLIVAVALYFILPRAFDAGRRSIQTPAEASRQP